MKNLIVSNNETLLDTKWSIKYNVMEATGARMVEKPQNVPIIFRFILHFLAKKNGSSFFLNVH